MSTLKQLFDLALRMVDGLQSDNERLVAIKADLESQIASAGPVEQTKDVGDLSVALVEAIAMVVHAEDQVTALKAENEQLKADKIAILSARAEVSDAGKEA